MADISGSQAVPAFGTTAADYGTAMACCHASAETVGACAL